MHLAHIISLHWRPYHSLDLYWTAEPDHRIRSLYRTPSCDHVEFRLRRIDRPTGGQRTFCDERTLRNSGRLPSSEDDGLISDKATSKCFFSKVRGNVSTGLVDGASI